MFGNPVISFTAVVAGMLICSAVGGFWSERLGRKAIRPCLGLLVLILAACAVGLDALILRFLGWPDAVRQTGAILVLAPIGFLMGIPFALGMRYVALGAPQRAVAWTANGCASVLAAIAAAQVAVAAGIPMILVFGLTAYLAAWLAAGRATG